MRGLATIRISVQRWIWIAVFAAVLGLLLAGLYYVDSTLTPENETEVRGDSE